MVAAPSILTTRCGATSGGWGTYQAALADRIEDKLPRLQMPVLLVRGERDPIANAQWLEQMASLLPNLQTRTLPRAPHALAFSDPVEVARLTEAFCLVDADEHADGR